MVAGHWQRALEHAAAARELGEQTQIGHSAPGWAGSEALVETDLGLVEEARARPRKALGSSRGDLGGDHIIPRLGVLGRLELALGNLEAAGAYLRELPGRLLAGGLNDPTRPSGRTRSRRSSRWASSSRPGRTSSRTRRTRGGSGVRGPSPALRAAAACSPPRRETSPARTRSLRGCPRRARQAALPARAGPHAALPRHGASAGAAEEGGPGGARAGARDLRGAGRTLWAEKARAELRRISGRRPARTELTETERRVAELAAAGPHEQGDRRRALHGREHGRGAPLPRLPQARRPTRTELAGRIASSGTRAAKRWASGPSLGLSGFRPPAPEPHLDGMVYVVERYLPGLAHSRLLRGLCRLERADEEQLARAHTVRYLGSTIVLGDEACFCQFEGPRRRPSPRRTRAGLPFDRIVPAVTVNTSKGAPPMTVSPSIPFHRRDAVEAGSSSSCSPPSRSSPRSITWALLVFAVNQGSENARRRAIATSTDALLSSLDAAVAREFVEGVMALSARAAGRHLRGRARRRASRRSARRCAGSSKGSRR